MGRGRRTFEGAECRAAETNVTKNRQHLTAVRTKKTLSGREVQFSVLSVSLLLLSADAVYLYHPVRF